MMGICAATMPISDHTAASTIRAMAPKNLRVRMVMTEMSGVCGRATCARGGADYKGRGRSFKRYRMFAFQQKTSPYGAVRVWLAAVAALIAIMVLVGGATRLTESGLSIVEWKPVTGALPPLGEAQWEQAFEAYKAIPQYQKMNDGMTLSEFKTIFWWEWSHRLLGRVIGAVYLLPFLYFLWR